MKHSFKSLLMFLLTLLALTFSAPGVVPAHAGTSNIIYSGPRNIVLFNHEGNVINLFDNPAVWDDMLISVSVQDYTNPKIYDVSNLITVHGNHVWFANDNSSSKASKFQAGGVINSSLSYYIEDFANFCNTLIHTVLSINDTSGNFCGQTGYAGFVLNDGVNNYYGWIQLRVDNYNNSNMSLTIIDWAYESTPNTGIKAGELPPPDTTAPNVDSVLSDTTDGFFKAGESISVKVKFNEVVNVNTNGGKPSLCFETGATDQCVDYASGSGTNTMLFDDYIVQAGDNSPDLEYVDPSALHLNGATIKDAANNNADLILPAAGAPGSFSESNNFVVDSTVPVGSIGAKPSDPTINTTADFTFSATDNFTIAPNFLFWCRLDAGTWEACDSGAKSYTTLAPGSHTFDVDAYDEAGNVANRQSYSWTIETVPTVTSINRAGASPASSATVDFTVTFSKSVTGVNLADFNLTTIDVSGAAVSGVSGSGSTYTVTVNTGSGNGTIRLDLIDDDSIRDVNNFLLGGTGTGNGSFTTGQLYSMIKVVTFADVPSTHWANSYIERLSVFNITGGCSVTPLSYCPDSTVTRAQMAVFLLKSTHGSSYTPPAVGSSTGFTDVAVDYWAAAWIKQLATEGITSGCGTGLYCPDSAVTRAQMAIFLLKAKHGTSYAPPTVGSSTGFIDVATTYWAAASIKQLVVEGITSGCGAGIYCPDSSVTRAQMAVFLIKTFNLP